MREESRGKLEKSSAFFVYSVFVDNDKRIKGKGQPGALKLPHTKGPGRGPTIWCIVRSRTLF